MVIVEMERMGRINGGVRLARTLQVRDRKGPKAAESLFKALVPELLWLDIGTAATVPESVVRAHMQ